jgi:multidrug efflux pump subunit AcrA (membrane-fusion protein)
MARLGNSSPTHVAPRLAAPVVALPPRLRALPSRRLLLALGAALLVVTLVGLRATQRPAEVVPAETIAAAKLVARGQVRPVAQARVGTLAGGTVARLAVAVGDAVDEEQEIARVRGPNGIEVLTAPWRGTITTVPAHLGDTVLPGAIVATIGDLSRLQVETTDVDEFLIAHVGKGQLLTMTVDALDGRELQGYVSSVALELQSIGTGDEHYPIALDRVDVPGSIRPGMVVRVHLPE